MKLPSAVTVQTPANAAAKRNDLKKKCQENTRWVASELCKRRAARRQSGKSEQKKVDESTPPVSSSDGL